MALVTTRPMTWDTCCTQCPSLHFHTYIHIHACMHTYINTYIHTHSAAYTSNWLPAASAVALRSATLLIWIPSFPRHSSSWRQRRATGVSHRRRWIRPAHCSSAKWRQQQGRWQNWPSELHWRAGEGCCQQCCCFVSASSIALQLPCHDCCCLHSFLPSFGCRRC